MRGSAHYALLTERICLANALLKNTHGQDNCRICVCSIGPLTLLQEVAANMCLTFQPYISIFAAAVTERAVGLSAYLGIFETEVTHVVVDQAEGKAPVHDSQTPLWGESVVSPHADKAREIFVRLCKSCR